MPGSLPEVRAILFDVFGTVVDWRTSVTRHLAAFARSRNLTADWSLVADSWRARYQPAMEDVRSGHRPWTILDVLHRETLAETLTEYDIPHPDDAAMDQLTRAWHQLDPWPDVIEGLTLLATRFTIGTLSNGNTALLTNLAAHAGLPWDVILGAETAQAYKPRPAAYLTNVALMGLEPHQTMLVAAHNSDLAAAASAGLRTGFVARPTEHGPGQTSDLTATDAWDVVADDFPSLADALRCA